MRMSCNGCRVLRKGCNDSCVLRPCLHWIRTAESQANATIFLAKFYGRAGLVNLISSGPEHLRPGIFRSLLYEACGRIVNPIYGSLGLFCSGNWAECQAGVERILRGTFGAVTQRDTASHILPIEAMASGLHRTRGRGRLKGLSNSKHKGKEGEIAAISNHMDSSSKSDDSGHGLTNEFQKVDNGQVYENYGKKYSKFLRGQEQEPQIEYNNDLCNLKTSQSEAPRNAVELELTLGSQGFSPCTPDKVSACDLRWGQAYWDQCMDK